VINSLNYRLPDAKVQSLRQNLLLAIESNPNHMKSVEWLAYLESIAGKPNVSNIERVQKMVGQERHPRRTLLSSAVIRWRFKGYETSEYILELLSKKKPLRG
jgi:hypothetical protein